MRAGLAEGLIQQGGRWKYRGESQLIAKLGDRFVDSPGNCGLADFEKASDVRLRMTLKKMEHEWGAEVVGEFFDGGIDEREEFGGRDVLREMCELGFVCFACGVIAAEVECAGGCDAMEVGGDGADGRVSGEFDEGGLGDVFSVV